MFHTTSTTSSPWFHLLGGPIVWATHFLVSYGWVEFACQARLLVLDSTIWEISILSHIVLLLTFIAVAATIYIGWSAYRRWQLLKNIQPTSEAAHWAVEGERFMAFSGILLCGLFALVILVTGLPALVIRPC